MGHLQISENLTNRCIKLKAQLPVLRMVRDILPSKTTEDASATFPVDDTELGEVLAVVEKAGLGVPGSWLPELHAEGKIEHLRASYEEALQRRLSAEERKRKAEEEEARLRAALEEARLEEARREEEAKQEAARQKEEEERELAKAVDAARQAEEAKHREEEKRKRQEAEAIE